MIRTLICMDISELIHCKVLFFFFNSYMSSFKLAVTRRSPNEISKFCLLEVINKMLIYVHLDSAPLL